MLLSHVKQKLEQSLPGAIVEVSDESAGHIEHNPTGAHISLIVTYSGFKDKTLLQQHQMIYDILKEELQEKIHALKIKTRVR